MDTINIVLARYTTDDLIVMDGPYLLGCPVKKGEDSTYMQIANCYAYSYVHGYSYN